LFRVKEGRRRKGEKRTNERRKQNERKKENEIGEETDGIFIYDEILNITERRIKRFKGDEGFIVDSLWTLTQNKNKEHDLQFFFRPVSDQ